LVIGPEGGFSGEEVQFLQEAGAVCVSLGRLTLRAETAGAAALAMVRYEFDE
ncbi:MAG TPA: 16S rRNA (uracil(1498)-N(3))-methyltransferase, partial [Clostridiales bacterium]|nr:16S rRNA (uracil(1498)-N(3))-methyltransferase [Clostridiales bacterium]